MKENRLIFDEAEPSEPNESIDVGPIEIKATPESAKSEVEKTSKLSDERVKSIIANLDKTLKDAGIGTPEDEQEWKELKQFVMEKIHKDKGQVTKKIDRIEKGTK